MIRKLKSDEGAVTLMTMAFMLTVGVMSIVFLWSLAVATGAYNTLYIANQNAAVAAAGVTIPEGSELHDEENKSGQLRYHCTGSSGSETMCVGSFTKPTSGSADKDQFKLTPSALAASKVMQKSLETKPFNLDYSYETPNVAFVAAPNVHHVPSQPVVEIINIARSSAEIKQALREGHQCLPKGVSGAFKTVAGRMPSAFPGDDDHLIHCWQLTERGVKFPVQTTSGVITRAQAKIDLVPGCSFAFCKGDIYVVAAAIQAQVQSVDDYSKYYYYNPWDSN